MESKPWYASKTIWANVIAFAATLATVFGLDLPFELTAEVQAEIVAAVMAMVNIVLRFVTDTPIGGDGE
jgi:hypothetical protein